MTKDELIVKQQLELEKYREMLEENRGLKFQIISKFYGCGQPLNDNVLQMNKEQIKWCFDVVGLAEDLNHL